MRSALLVAFVLVSAAAPLAQADASPPERGQRWAATGHSLRPRLADERSCATDGLIHAEVSAAISEHVTNAIQLLEPGARIRDVAKLGLPCSFRLDARSGWNLVLTNGKEARGYVENNAFGFAPAFGFGEQNEKSYTLNYRPIADGAPRSDDCRSVKGAPQLCSSFGSQTAFFGASPGQGGTRIAHYVVHGSEMAEDFPVAEVQGHVESIFFLPPPDAPGGTITIVMTDREGTYRAFLDTPKG
jgi:hypothetical protein